jgi:hypothetical protein
MGRKRQGGKERREKGNEAESRRCGESEKMNRKSIKHEKLIADG